MNRPLGWWFLVPLALASVSTADSIKDYVKHRFNADHVEVSEIQGLQQRIEDGKLHLRLHDFLELVLKNATDIHVTRLDVYTAANQIISAKSPFDPTLGLQFNTLRSVSPLFFGGGGFGTSGSTTGSGTTETPGQTTGSAGANSLINVVLPATISSLSQNSAITYQQLLTTGQTISTNFSVNRSSGDGFPFPAIFGSLNVQITQPLWQNRTNLQLRAPLTIARTELIISSEQSEATIGDTVAAAARQYWDAILARDNIRVQEQNVALAQKSYEHDKKALDLGAIAKLDILQSETQVAERNRDLVQARFQYQIDLDALRRPIGADLTPALRDTDVVLEDDPSMLPPKSAILPFEQALAQATQVRPELKAAQQKLSVDDLNARVARDQLKPQLNLSLQGGANGPGLNQIAVGSTIGTISNTPFPGLGETLKQTLAFDFPSYGFGVQLNFPLRNSTAQASLADSLVSKTRDQYQKRLTQQQIVFDVRQALDSIELADASISAAITARDLAEKNVEAEQQKYVLGSITAFELLDSQTRLASSQSALLNAYVTYQEAYINYERATWTLLDGYGIIVQSPKVN